MLTKNQFIEFIAENYNTTKKNAGEIIEIFTDAFKKATLEEDGVGLVGFIKSEIVERPARDGINPKTKEKIKIVAKKYVKISAYPKFKNMED